MDEIINKKKIVEIAVGAVEKVIAERFGGYSSPLNKIADQVIEDNSDKFKKIFEGALAYTLDNATFKKAVKEEFLHKVAKSMVGKLEGTVEKAVEKLRQDQTLRARMILAIENIIKENE